MLLGYTDKKEESLCSIELISKNPEPIFYGDKTIGKSKIVVVVCFLSSKYFNKVRGIHKRRWQ